MTSLWGGDLVGKDRFLCEKHPTKQTQADLPVLGSGIARAVAPHSYVGGGLG